MTESNELVVIKQANIPAIFIKDGCDPIIEGLKKEAAKFEGDITTAKGRKEIASFARKFSTAKSYLDKLGKTLSDEYRAKIAPINVERNKIETCCNELRDQIRKPLTDWEDAEKERVQRHENAIQFINNHLEVEFEDSAHVAKLIEMVKGVMVGEVFEEFELAATKAKEAALTQLEAKFIVLQNAEKHKAEAERLEKERLEKEQKECEEKIAEEAAEKAKQEAEEKAKAEAEEKDRLAREAIEKAERETLEAKLETERVEKEKREAAEQADRDKEQAVEDEKKRQTIQAEADRTAEEKRQANKRHRNKIHKEAKASMLEQGISEEDATMFVTLVKDELVKHITIDY